MTSNRTHRRAGVLAGAVASILVLGSAGVWAQLDYQLVWSDEFDGNQVDPAKWEFQIGNGCPDLCGWGNNELQYYRVENATVADGRLTITAKEEDFAGYDYTSARMRTVGLGDWTYGRIEMRARMPIGQGLWPAFWMLPTDWVYGGWAASGEIDIVEYLGHEPDELLSAIHYGGPWPENASWASTFQLPGGAPTFHEEFHDFALEWTPNELRWYVDGSQVACQSHWYSTAAEYPAPFDQDMHLLLNMAVGGDLPGPPDPATDFPQDYVIEHVRVLQRPEFPQCETLFDGMDHANPFGNGWFAFDGSANGGIGVSTVDLSTEGCNASLGVGWGSGEPSGYFGGFGRTFPVDLSERTHFTLWINPDAGQEFTIEVNLQEDDDGDDAIPGTPDGADDEFQFDCTIGPMGPCAVAGGGWQRVSIPLESFYDDNSYHYGGNGVFDPVPTGAGGNGRLVNVVFVLISHAGGNVTFRTDKWLFTREEGSIAGRVWSDDDGDGAQGAGEPGLGGVVVDLLDSASSAVESTTTDGNGEFQFEALPSDGYTVAIDSSSLPAGASPTTDPDGLATPHAAELVLGCADSSSANDFGYSPAPSPIPPDFTVAKDPADAEQIVVGYDTSTCYAPDHAVLFGLLGDFTTVTAADCSIGNSGSATIPSPAGNVWLLVVGHDGTRYSSAGQSTAGERSLLEVPTQCPALASQDLSASCP